MILSVENIEACLLKSWSVHTSSKWTIENPYKGHCGVTALVLHDLLGYKILKTKIEGQWHYYNEIDGQRFDFTRKQFLFELNYEDSESNREEAFSDTNDSQYTLLKYAMEKELFGKIDEQNSECYKWGDNCMGWHLVKTDNLSVIKELMPPRTEEKLHYHSKSQQFFYVLSGVATFSIDGQICIVEQNKGIHIKQGTIHNIRNNSDSELVFLVISEPKSHGDKTNVL